MSGINRLWPFLVATGQATALARPRRVTRTPNKNSARYGKPHQGPKECARRIKQGINGTRYVHGNQYQSRT